MSSVMRCSPLARSSSPPRRHPPLLTAPAGQGVSDRKNLCRACPFFFWCWGGRPLGTAGPPPPHTQKHVQGHHKQNTQSTCLLAPSRRTWPRTQCAHGAPCAPPKASSTDLSPALHSRVRCQATPPPPPCRVWHTTQPLSSASRRRGRCTRVGLPVGSGSRHLGLVSEACLRFGWFPGPRSLKARAQYKSNNHLTGGSAHCEEERQ